MKQLFGQPPRGHWILPKPSRVTSRGLARSKGKDCRLVSAAEVEVGPELALEVCPELALEVSLEIMPEPIVKVIPIVTYKMYALGPPTRKRVTFSDPEVEKSPEGDEANCSTEPSVVDIEMWLEWQAWQLGTPAWWVELGAIPGIKDLQKFAWKIWASFYIPEVQMRASLEWEYTMPPAPQKHEQECLSSRKISIPRCATTTGTPNHCLCPKSPILGREV